MRQSIRYTLESAGYQVIEAVDGADAVPNRGTAIDLVITDLNMPVMDGLGLINEVRAHPAARFVPVIVLTTESAQLKKQAAPAPPAGS